MLIFLVNFLFLSVLANSESTVDIGRVNNQFGMTLYNEISKNSKENIIFSPYSMYSVLGLLLGATNGDSRTQLLEALKVSEFSKSEEKIHEALSILAEELDSSNSVEVNHGLFVADFFNIYDSYVKFAKKYYEAIVETKKFPDPGQEEINKWVEEKTNGMIKNLLSGLTSMTRAVLVNTIHFKNTWRDQFRKEMTKSHQFALIGENVYDGTYVTYMMEDKKSKELYGEHRIQGTKFKSLELEFQREDDRSTDYGMMFLLPKKNTAKSFRNLEKAFLRQSKKSQGLISRIQKDQKRKDVQVKIPRFEIEWKDDINVILAKIMGVKDVFDEQDADLSRIADISVEQLKVDRVLQQAKIRVDEEGCEAAAASAVVMVATSMPMRPPKPKTFFAHRPFMYVLYHKKTNSILFMGKVMEPEKSEENIEVFVRDYFSGSFLPDIPRPGGRSVFAYVLIILVGVVSFVMVVSFVVCIAMCIIKRARRKRIEEKHQFSELKGSDDTLESEKRESSSEVEPVETEMQAMDNLKDDL